MVSVFSYYFSRVVGNRVLLSNGSVLGRLKDLVADTSLKRPRIVGAVISNGHVTSIIDYSSIHMEKVKEQYKISCTSPDILAVENVEYVQIGKYIQDRQLVDTNGRKLVRVNDIEIAVFASGSYLLAVDVGVEGLMRRLGIAKPIQQILNIFHKTLHGHLILWDDVDAIGFGHSVIKLSKETSNLDKLHPSDLADIIEEMDYNLQVNVFKSLSVERAAEVLEELDSDTRESLLESLPADIIADMLDIMPADEVADILDEVSEEKAEALLHEMEAETSHEVRELMEYPDNCVGSIMTTDFISFYEHNTVGETLEILRREKPDPDIMYYLYIVSDIGELKATVSLRDIVIADPNIHLGDIMNDNIVYVHEYDRIDSINEIISKYNLLAVPVVNSEKILLGMVIISDVVYNLLKSRRRRL